MTEASALLKDELDSRKFLETREIGVQLNGTLGS